MQEKIIDTGGLVIFDHLMKTNGVGSCVVIIFFDRKKKLGGMAHSMLPERLTGDSDYFSAPGKYVNEAIDNLFERFLKRGSNAADLAAVLVGGAEMFPSLSGDYFTVGYQNLQTAKRCLAETGVALIDESVGGHFGRSVSLDPQSGKLIITARNPNAPFSTKIINLLQS